MSQKLMQKTALALIFLSITVVNGCASLNGNDIRRRQPDNQILAKKFYYDIIVPVTINNKTYNFLVDTGASVTVIDKKLAAKITRPLRVDELSSTLRERYTKIITVNGLVDKKQFNLIKALPFYIGNEEVRDNDVWLALDIDLFSQSMGVKIDGIIGIDTFRKFNWQIDNRTRQMLISRDAPFTLNWQHCTGYDDSFNGSPQIWLKFEGQDIPFRIDTGATQGYLAHEFITLAEKNNEILTVDNPDTKSIAIDGIRNMPSYLMRKLIFENFPLGEINMGVSQNQLYGLGMDFLSRFDRYAFIPSRMMFCYNTSSLEKQQQASLRNISVHFNGRQIALILNTENELKNSGLQNGDIILRINGKAYPTAEIEKVRSLLALTPTGKLTLTIQRGNIIKEFRL